MTIEYKEMIMAQRSWISDWRYREVSDDGRRSDVYETGPLGGSVWLETAVHHADGTTEAFEAPSWGDTLNGSTRGAKK